MKKIFAVLVIMGLMLGSCERDEICLEDITPKLVIRFSDHEEPSDFKSVLQLEVAIEGIDGIYEDESITLSTDSIAIPLKVTETKTRYILTLKGIESEGIPDNTDTLDVSYTMEDIFVSRSCGYKSVYYGLQSTVIPDDDNWIKDLTTRTDPQDVTTETRYHVKIFH